MKLPTLKMPNLPARAPRGVGTEPLAAYAESGHLLATPDGVWAYYALQGQDMHGRSADERAAIQRAQAHRWGELRGHRVYVRQTSHPFDHNAWARRIDLQHPHPDLPPEKITDAMVTRRLIDRPGAPSFGDVLAAGQVLAGGTGRRKTQAVLGVRISTRPVKGVAELDVILKASPVASPKLEDARSARARIDAAVAKAGFEGTPLTTNSLAWLTHASLGMGAPVPPVLIDYPGRKSWDENAVPGFTNPVQASEDPYGLTTELKIARDSTVYTKHVAIQYVDRFHDRSEAADPFLGWTLAYPTPLEVVGVFDVIDGNQLKRQAEKARRKARDIEHHHLEHDQDPPREVARGIELALDIEDQLAHGDTPTRTRLVGSWCVAVVRDTEHEACEAARAVRVAAEEEAGVVLYHDYGQYDLWRAFTPGEPFPATGGHVCQAPARFAASALMPNVSVEAGDPTGFLVGPVAGGHDLMLFDPFGGARRNLSGVNLVCADQGGGKSALAGSLLWWTARLGIRTLAVDPSGPWKRLTQLSDLKRDAHFLDMASATPGTLVPTIMVPEPRRRDYPDETSWRNAVATSEANRIELMVDTLYGLLPYGYRQSEHKASAIITSVCSRIGGAYGENPWRYVEALRADTEYGLLAREIAGQLDAAAKMRGALIFPAPGTEVDPGKAKGLLNRATFTVISTHGMPVPPHGVSDMNKWTPAQQASVPIHNLVANLATLAMYESRDEPVNLTFDELRQVNSVGSSFTSLVNRLVVDSRKFFGHVGLLFQSPRMVMELDESIANLAGCIWVGRLDEKDAKDARVLLRDNDLGSGIEARIADQTAGEFTVLDWLKRRRQVYVDRSWWSDELLKALDTTPGQRGQYDDAPSSLFGVSA